jgi:nitroreductase
MINPVLKAIKNRRSSTMFDATSVDDKKLKAILEAGRWAPSWANAQPWRFIIIKDQETKERMSNAALTFFRLTIKDAPICIAVCVNPKEEPYHFIEDGTTATQNMALAAQSLGLSTTWIGVFSLPNKKNSSERKIKEILKIPKEWRLISILPLGNPKSKETKTRKDLSEIADLNFFIKKEEHKLKSEEMKKPSAEIRKTPQPTSARELEPAIV